MFKVILDYIASLRPFGARDGKKREEGRGDKRQVIYKARVVCNEAES